MRHGDAKAGAVTGVRWKSARGRRRWVARAALLSLLGLGGSLGWGRGVAIALPIDYFALGDSVASGYGLGRRWDHLSSVHAGVSLAALCAFAGDLHRAPVRSPGLFGHHHGNARAPSLRGP